MNLSLGTQWVKATDLTPYEAHNDIFSICTYLYEYVSKSHYIKRNHMFLNIYIWDSHPFVVQVGFEFIGCSRNVKRKPYSVCLVIVLLIINII